MLGHQYIMGQGVPYAFQQPMYSYEELQLVQQRIPHMVSYYPIDSFVDSSTQTYCFFILSYEYNASLLSNVRISEKQTNRPVRSPLVDA